jgi:hypothetical protein
MESRLYTALSEVEGRLNARFDKMDARFNEVLKQLADMSIQLAQVTKAIKKHQHGS